MCTHTYTHKIRNLKKNTQILSQQAHESIFSMVRHLRNEMKIMSPLENTEKLGASRIAVGKELELKHEDLILDGQYLHQKLGMMLSVSTESQHWGHRDR